MCAKTRTVQLHVMCRETIAFPEQASLVDNLKEVKALSNINPNLRHQSLREESIQKAKQIQLLVSPK